MRPFDDINRLSNAPSFDRFAAPVRDIAKKVLGSQRLRDALHGVWLGHPLHPLLVQMPIGAFLSSALLDWMRGQERGADALIRIGLVGSIPAAAAGSADYVHGHEEQQRVGVVHAAANTAAVLCYLTSLRLRATDRRAAGVATGLAGLALTAASGALGGHMSYQLAMGANHAQSVPHTGPAEWTDIGRLDELPEGQPAGRMAGDVAVVVVRDDPRVDVLADTCAHASAPLRQGEVIEHHGTRCLRCPWHGSVFRLADGAVVHGPATAPQPGFDSRVVDGRVQTRVRTFPCVPTAG